MLAAKSTVLLAAFAVSIPLASAIPPACLLQAVNTQSSPADLQTLCGKDSSQVQDAIKDACGEDTEAALDAYRNTCNEIGKIIPSQSPSSQPSKTVSATPQSTFTPTSDYTVQSSATAADATISTSAVLTPYPVTYTSTYSTKTSPDSYISIAIASGATGSASFIGSGSPSNGSNSGPGSGATGSPILPAGTSAPGSSVTSSPFNGAASKNFVALSAGMFAIANLVLAL